jgi:DNA helicase IV
MVEPATHTAAVDPEIQAEAAYLAAARAALRGMHEQVVSTETPELDGEEKDEIWHNTMYRLARARRARDLVDLPDVPLFFGRLDYQPGSAYGADQVYIGRRHVRDAGGTPMVVDWRAPVSMPFYRASRDDPQGVWLRRRYGFSDAAELTAYEDEPLVGTPDGFGGSALVAAEIERPRAGPMRDIVATIQPDQDELVRAPLHPTVCIQGAPGTGKTAVGLHRLAYLLYTERDRLGEVAVVGPNRSFLTYIRRVLPALGEVDVSQTTIEELIGRRVVRPAEPDPEVARIKGDARMATVLHRALWRRVGTGVPEDGLVYIAGSQRYRVGAARIAETIEGLRGTTRYLSGRTALAQRLAHLILYQMERRGATPDDRDQAAVARSKPVKQLLDQVWPKATPEQALYGLLADPALLAEAAEGVLGADEQARLRWPKPARSWRSAQWTTADAVLLDELADLVERTPSLGHVVVDEAQDLSPMQARALGRRAGGSLTVLGDLAQATSPWAAGDWSVLLAHLGQPDARLAVLDQGFRVPAQIIDYAARLLPEIAPGLGTPRSVRRATGALHITRTSEEALVGALAAACREGLAGDGSVGLIVAEPDAAAVHRRLVDGGLAAALLGETEDAMETARLVCVPATLAKGLEFDAVVVAEPARIVAAEPRGLHRLYVVLTRAVSSLHLVHAEPLPAALREPVPA